jgi:hypothetical protein
MLARRLMLIGAALLLMAATAQRSAPRPIDDGDATDFDVADPPGLIVLHIHADGRVHLHIHLFGGELAFFLPGAVAAPPVAHPAVIPPNQPAALPSPIQRGVTALAALLTVSLVAAYRQGRMQAAAAPRRVGPRFPPADPPPRWR